MRVDVNPIMLRWARERSRLPVEGFYSRFPQLDRWERSEVKPTLKQLESYAKATLTPIGYFFLPEPLVERLPIPDFRTVADRALAEPSPNLLDTIYACQQRQGWYREYAQSHGLRPLSFVGSLTVERSAIDAAFAMRSELKFDLEARRDYRTWEEALRAFIAQAEAIGVLVMNSGVVQNNNYRHLDPQEFRGFSLADSLAPAVFINGADSKAAQMFTLAHELAHLWIGQSALSNAEASDMDGQATERWCNQVAAELLVPLDTIRGEIGNNEPLNEMTSRLARRFKVSTLVILRRLFDVGHLTRESFWQEYNAELARIRALPRSSGGNFYLSQAARVSKRFARALVESTLEGQTLYRDAMQMLGISKVETFNELGRSLNFPT